MRGNFLSMENNLRARRYQLTLSAETRGAAVLVPGGVWYAYSVIEIEWLYGQRPRAISSLSMV